jgi:hypothetical protein
MSKTEHILLESEDRDIPELRTARKVHARLRSRSRLRRRVLELDIIDYYYLSVRMQRRSTLLEYVLDLRFIDPRIRESRHIAWRWMIATLAFAMLTAASVWRLGSSPAPWWQHGQLPICATMLVLTACVGLVCVYRTTETLTLRSVHGQARLLELTGGLGTLRATRPFMLKLAAHIRIAIAARRSSRAQHLRDEMREHFHLKEAGVLSDEEYEESKRRILAEHAPA